MSERVSNLLPRTSDRDDFIIWMDAGFHGTSICRSGRMTSLFARRHRLESTVGRRKPAPQNRADYIKSNRHGRHKPPPAPHNKSPIGLSGPRLEPCASTFPLLSTISVDNSVDAAKPLDSDGGNSSNC